MYLANFTKTAFWFPDQAIRKHLHANEFGKAVTWARPLIPVHAWRRGLRANAVAERRRRQR
ncbi:hypothetical protein, partial [Mesorhizobium sp. M7A.F.Ca.CA.001.07.2.1]|uniref:hypothetical protein n=1 Tax=Mesorhizobium sp. M7A.F.Ca.CA.001.07.2.1 TaxID=2496684 RepID=UPI0019D45CDF